jgi:plasmid replication initiation protein
MNDIVKYHNDMNEICLKDFTANELDLLMTICAQMKDKNDAEVLLKYDDLMHTLSWNTDKGIDKFQEYLHSLSRKMKQCGGSYQDKKRFKEFNFFGDFDGDIEARILTVKVNPDYVYILNNLSKYFTTFELHEYIKIDGKYPKLLYQHLKRYKTSGFWDISIEDFKKQLAISENTRPKDVTNRIVSNSVKTLKEKFECFKNLTYEVKTSRRRGNPISGYIFKFDPEELTTDQKEAIKHIKNGDYQQPAAKKTADFQQNSYDFNQLEKDLLAN